MPHHIKMTDLPTEIPDNEDLPQLFQAADTASIEAQNEHMRGLRARLALLTVAAGLGLASWRQEGSEGLDWPALLASILFVGTLSIEAVLWFHRPDRRWYDARAVAESTKTLAWKFAVRGEPFLDPETDEQEIARVFVDRLGRLRAQYPNLELAPSGGSGVTKWMQDVRAQPWDQRRETYLRGRLMDQKTWYAAKAEVNKRRASQWRVALVLFEFLGFVSALFAAINSSVPALAPFFATLTACVATWLVARQHDFNWRAYSAAVADLALAQTRLEAATSEQDWANEVSDSEDAISREHTLWLASRAQLRM